MLRAFAPAAENKHEIAAQMVEDESALDMLVCGEVLLVKHQWRVCYTCSFCGKVADALEDLLRHSLEAHVSDVTSEESRKLLDNLKLRNENASLSEETSATTDVAQTAENDVKETIGTNAEIKSESPVEIMDDAQLAAGLETETDTEDSEGDQHERDWDGLSMSSDSSASTKEISNFEVVLLESKSARADSSVRAHKRINTRRCKCPVCNEVFGKRYELVAHLKGHSGYKPYACDYCDAHFRDQTNLKVHRYRHLGIKPHKCTMCEKAFTSSTELKLHLRSHTGERPYTCTDCDKTFASAAHRAWHRRRHSKDRPFLCNICGKGYYDNKLLKAHMVVHTNERPFVCKQCPMKFAIRKNLAQHSKLHATVKQYACKHCGNRFSQPAGLYSHMKTHHATKR